MVGARGNEYEPRDIFVNSRVEKVVFALCVASHHVSTLKFSVTLALKIGYSLLKFCLISFTIQVYSINCLFFQFLKSDIRDVNHVCEAF